jgi:hypothetical protein
MSKADELKSATLKLEAVDLQTEATETRATKSHRRTNRHPWGSFCPSDGCKDKIAGTEENS